MAFFGYDPYYYGYDEYEPYGYYYAAAAPYNYYDRYYQRQPAAGQRSTKDIFASAETAAAAKPAPKARKARDTKTSSFSIPVHGPDSDPEPERKTAAAGARREKSVAPPAMSAEEAAVRMQAVARGLLERKAVRAVREAHRKAEQIQAEMASDAETLVANPRMRKAVGEDLMRIVCGLDEVRGARDYRRRVTKLVVALQDTVDALGTKPAPTPVEMAEESTVVPELADTVERINEMESIKSAVDTPTQVEVDEAKAASEPEVDVDEPEGSEPEAELGEEKEAALGATNVDADEVESSEAEGEWEMVTEANQDTEPVAATSSDDKACKEPAYLLETMSAASVGATSDDGGVDTRKLMEMVAALCEQSAKHCAVIGALAERVDALERTVLQMESKKLITEGK